MTPTTVAIQIVNYKTKAFLDPLLTSIQSYGLDHAIALTIYIVDNASGDDLSDIPAAYTGLNIQVYESPHNGGFGAGHNFLASKHSAEYLLLLNPDTALVQPHTIMRLLDTLRKTKASVVGPRLVTPVERTGMLPTKINIAALQQQPWDHGRDSIWHFKKTAQLSEVIWVSGAAFLLSHTDFTSADGFDEKFFLYYEEVDLCRRLRRKGKNIFYDPEIVIAHYGSAVASKYSKHMLRSFLRYQLKTLHK